LMMEATHSSETSDFTGATRRIIPEDGIFVRFARFTVKSRLNYPLLPAESF
jgi:hypothetical protein